MSHVLGAALLVGAIVTLDIQVLRRASNVGMIARAVTPVAACGSGTVLLAADAMQAVVNPVFQFKMAMSSLALSTWRSSAGALLAASRRRFPLRGRHGLQPYLSRAGCWCCWQGDLSRICERAYLLRKREKVGICQPASRKFRRASPQDLKARQDRLESRPYRRMAEASRRSRRFRARLPVFP
jgi:hypothetical protein